MTKKQNRVRGFGRRSLSMLLAMLMLLSTMAVMLTSTMLTASAEISYWYLVGDFNGWNLNDETFKMTKNGNDWVVTVPPVAVNGFKAIAVENGNRNWNGVDVNSVELEHSGGYKLHWESGGNSGKDIKIANAPENPTGYTVYIWADNGNNISIVANTVPTEAGDKNVGKTFTADAPVSPGNTDGNGIFWAKATYFDYISDWEHGHTNWLKPIKAGTGHNWSNDEWYPFFGINNIISSQYNGKSAHPLYFGNYCWVDGAYDTSGHHYGSSNGYDTAINGLTDFQYAVNNSNAKNNSSVGGQGLANANQSYQGLMSDHLGANGELLMAGDNVEAPYFNAAALGTYANVVNSAFPFRVTDNGAYKTYQFNSNNGLDNVYFTWAKDGNSTKPTAVNYGSYDYKVKDGLDQFLNDQGSGFGIFPFNNGSSTNKGNKNNTNENLDYGFGVKMEVKFRVPAPNASTGVNYGNNKIMFDFSGDDDLWMYITDEDNNSYLVLDMGGNHKKSHGSVDFSSLSSTVDHVYQGNTTSDASVTWDFADDIGLDFDYNKTYTMTVFYMERGLIESNCEMTFSMYPAGNQVNVEKEVNVASINSTSTSKALQNAVAAVDTFDFTASQASSENETYSALKDTEYMDNYYGNKKTSSGDGSFSLEDTEMASFMSQYTTNNYVKITEVDPNSGKNLSYTTKWSVSDPFKPSRNLTDQTGLTTTAMRLVEKGTAGEPDRADPNEYAQLDYKFVNTPDTGSVSVTKTVDSTKAADLAQEFNAKVEISLEGGTAGTFHSYPMTYSASDKAGTFETNASGNLSSSALLKNGRTLTFNNLPTNAVVRVTEQLSAAQTEAFAVSYPSGNTVTVPNDSTGTISVKNTPTTIEPVHGTVTGKKMLDNENYTGDMFTFVLKGVYFDGDENDPTLKDTRSTELTTSSVTGGTFSFDELTFNEAGIYRYHVYEDMSALAQDDTSFDTDYESNITDYLVKFTVTEVNHALQVDGPTYYSYSKYEEMVAGPDASGEPVEHTMSSDDFDPQKELDSADDFVFYNYLNKGNITIEKTNQKGENVSGVTFVVYKVDEWMDLILSNNRLSDSEKYDRLLMQIGLSDEDLEVGRGTTGADGVAYINDIPIYQDGFVQASASGVTVNKDDFTGYQKYVLLEISSTGTNGYSLNKTVSNRQVFSFPIDGQYDYTFSYINNQLKNPSTAGSGMTIFKIIGLVLAGLSVLALGGYVLYTKKYAKRKTAKHFAK